MEIIKQGAEAILYIDSWEGQRVLVKERIKKRYRVPQIDERLRKERTVKETKLLRDVRMLGVPTPQILHVDKKDHKIIMEFIDGERVKEFLGHANEEEIESVCEQIGQLIGKMHAADIVHGDLTTSNMIFRGGKVYFIDFGLGQHTKRVEDKGVDLRLLYGAIKAAHYNTLGICWASVLKGYKKEYKNADIVIKKIEEIAKRTRYAKRD
jgi:TP53 regulating kinase-like protein